MMLTNKLSIGSLALLASLFLLRFARVKEDEGLSLPSSINVSGSSTRARGLSLIDLSDPKSTVLKEIDEPCCVRPCATSNFNDNVPCCILGCSDVSEWPSSIVPEGIYTHVSSSPLQTTQPSDYGRVLIYITTHFSQQHEMYLKYCWRNLLARSPMLQGADVAVYLNPNEEERRIEAMDVLKETFVDHNLVVYLRSYDKPMDGTIRKRAKFTTGATLAMYEAISSNYFDGYDWVIRVNPDVLIRDDSFLREWMVDPSVSALVINCKGEVTYNIMLHTDFFMIRPDVLRVENLPTKVNYGTEQTFTDSIRTTVLDQKKYRWVPDAWPLAKRACRAGQGRNFFDSPIIHEHALHPDICSVPEADMPIVNSVFTDPWPPSWTPV